MRRLMAITAFSLFLTVSLWAQRGGGHGGFSGGHGGGFSGHAAFSGGGHLGGSHFSGGMRSGAGFSRGPIHASHFGSSREPFLHDGFRGDRFRGRGFRGFRRNCFGYGCWGYGYPWAYGGYYDPFWWGDSGSSYDDDYERNLAIANEMNEQSLEEQRMLRQEEADGDRDLYARPDPAPRAASGSERQGTAIMPPTVLIFRDQRQREIQNYAIVGQTLWNFAPGHTEKISLSELDLAATAKANDDRGVTFRVPTSNEAQ